MRDVLLNKAIDVLRRGIRPHYVYFIYAPGSPDVVKIGTAVDVDQRLSALRTGGTKAPEWIRPETLRLLGWVEGDQELESLLHRAFKSDRVVGEWFNYDAIADDINKLLDGWCLCRGCYTKEKNLAHF